MGIWNNHRGRQAGKYAKKSYRREQTWRTAELKAERRQLKAERKVDRKAHRRQELVDAQDRYRVLTSRPNIVPPRPDQEN